MSEIDIVEKYSGGVCRINAYSAKLMSFSRPFDKRRIMPSVGTGFFIEKNQKEEDGDTQYVVILTCYHVIEGCSSDSVKIILPKMGKKELSCEILFVCPAFDIAFLCLPIQHDVFKEYIKYMPLGDSDQVKKGTEVFTMGFPAGQDGLKISKGHVAGRDRSLIQITAPISQGNSGGPSFVITNDEIRVVGINSQGLSGSGVSNIGYCIPTQIVFVTMERGLQQIDRKSDSLEKQIVDIPSIGLCWHSVNSKNDEPGVCIYHVQKGSDLAKEIENKASPFSMGDLLVGISWKEKEGSYYTYQEKEVVSIDNRGQVKVKFNPQKVNLEYMINRIPLDSTITLHMKGSKGKMEPYKVTCMKSCMATGGNKMVYEPFTTPDSLCFAGFCFMVLRRNHSIGSNPLDVLFCVKSMTPADLEKENVIVSQVFKSENPIHSTLGEGNVIVSVNDVDIRDQDEPLKMMREEILRSLREGKKITIKEKAGKTASVSPQDVYQMESRANKLKLYSVDQDVLSLTEPTTQEPQ